MSLFERIRWAASAKQAEREVRLHDPPLFKALADSSGVKNRKEGLVHTESMTSPSLKPRLSIRRLTRRTHSDDSRRKYSTAPSDRIEFPVLEPVWHLHTSNGVSLTPLQVENRDRPMYTEALSSITTLKPKLSIRRFKRRSNPVEDPEPRKSLNSELESPAQVKPHYVENIPPPMQGIMEQTEGGLPETHQPHRSVSVKRLWNRHSPRPSIHTQEEYVGPNYFDSGWGLDGSESMQFVTAEKSARLCRSGRRRSTRAEIIDPFMKAPQDQEGNLVPASSFFAP